MPSPRVTTEASNHEGQSVTQPEEEMEVLGPHDPCTWAPGKRVVTGDHPGLRTGPWPLKAGFALGQDQPWEGRAHLHPGRWLC